MTDHSHYYQKSDDYSYRKSTLRLNIEKDNEERKYRQSVIDKLSKNSFPYITL